MLGLHGQAVSYTGHEASGSDDTTVPRAVPGADSTGLRRAHQGKAEEEEAPPEGFQAPPPREDRLPSVLPV